MPSIKHKLASRVPCVALGLAVLLAAAPAVSLPEDRDQPIRVEADSAVQQNGTVTYTGDVVITQGSTRITGAEVVVQHVDGRVQQLDAIGNPATFHQLPEAGSDPVDGRGLHLIYFQNDNRIELLKQAVVERGGNTVAGNRIEYFADTGVVRAEGSHDDRAGRVEMVLQPDQSSRAPAPPASDRDDVGDTAEQSPATPSDTEQ